ncbi:recombination mediator RecR [Ignatzschineria larvae DSM 13226]|uniref:Recombination protein RecR n=1 Tax=Ignatzschineria larvae DSM 13226 TaxID=1111732 RepID=A0ABZ3BWU9_9GAMM|nr:recombination mediator RecR [Ignatzschineria larvae]
MYPKALQDLIDALRLLPGIGQKSALRMALYLLDRNRKGAEKMARSLSDALEHIHKCRVCRNLTDEDVCVDCANPKKDDSLLCIVENPADVFALRQNVEYKGRYFVLYGRLSPLDGIGPSELGLDLLEQRFKDESIREIILAMNSTVEGEATAHYISEIAKQYGIAVSRIAQGIPLGGELEYLDGGTLSHAFAARKSY